MQDKQAGVTASVWSLSELSEADVKPSLSPPAGEVNYWQNDPHDLYFTQKFKCTVEKSKQTDRYALHRKYGQMKPKRADCAKQIH